MTGRRLSEVSTLEPSDRYAIFLNCTLQKPRIIVQYSVIVGENLMLFHQARPHYDHFYSQFYPPSKDDETVQEWGKFGSIGMAEYYKWLVLPPHGLNLCEDAVLPPHELNCWEDFRHEHITYHPMQSRQGEDAWLSNMDTGKSICQLVTSVNHSIQVVNLYSGSKTSHCHQTYLVFRWSPLHRQTTKANSIQSMHESTLLSSLPIAFRIRIDGYDSDRCFSWFGEM